MDALSLIERRSANQALLESRLEECVNELRSCIRAMERNGITVPAASARTVASRSSDALRTIREGDAL